MGSIHGNDGYNGNDCTRLCISKQGNSTMKLARIGFTTEGSTFRIFTSTVYLKSYNSLILVNINALSNTYLFYSYEYLVYAISLPYSDQSRPKIYA